MLRKKEKNDDISITVHFSISFLMKKNQMKLFISFWAIFKNMPGPVTIVASSGFTLVPKTTSTSSTKSAGSRFNMTATETQNFL